MIDFGAMERAAGLKACDAVRILQQTRPYQVFLPNKAQADFTRAIGNLTPAKRIFLATSGNGTGKTTIAVNILANIAYPEKNIWRDIRCVETGEQYSGFFDYPLFQQWPEGWPKKAWYVSNNDSIKNSIDEFLAWLPEGDYQTFKDGKNHISRIIAGNWTFEFKTIDQDPQTFEGANISLLIFDEPPPVSLYRAGISRLRRGGIVIIPATPLFGASWFVDEIIEKIDDDGDKYHQTVTVWENTIETAGEWDLGPFGVHPKGVLRRADVDFQLANYDPDELVARRDGVFQYLTGVVYKTYDRKVHFRAVDPPQHPKRPMYRFIMDPHDRRPPAAVWIRFDRFSRRTAFREWPAVTDPQYNGLMFHRIKDAGPYTIKDFVRFWIEIEEEHQIPPDRITRIIDPNFGRKINRQTGLTVAQEYYKASEEVCKEMGLTGKRARLFSFVTDVIDDLATGHTAVKELLKPTVDGDLPLVVAEGCVNLDYGLRNYKYAERTPKEEEKHGQPDNKVQEFAKDFPDLLRYDAVLPFYWTAPPPSDDPYEREDYGDKKGAANWRNKAFRGKGAEFA